MAWRCTAGTGAALENVIQPQVPLALRLSAQLLLGVARIYSRKAKYLLDDCNEALAKVKLVGPARPPDGVVRARRRDRAHRAVARTWGGGGPVRDGQAFHAGAVDLPQGQATVSYGAITLGDALFDLDGISALPDATTDFIGYGPRPNHTAIARPLPRMASALTSYHPRAPRHFPPCACVRRLENVLNLSQHQSASDLQINLRPRASLLQLPGTGA